MDELNSTVAAHDDVQKNYVSLSAQFTAQKQQLHDEGREKNQLMQELKSVKSQLNDCKQEIRSAKQNLDQCKTDAENELWKEQEKCKKRVDDLQEHLTQVQTEMQTQVSSRRGRAHTTATQIISDELTFHFRLRSRMTSSSSCRKAGNSTRTRRKNKSLA